MLASRHLVSSGVASCSGKPKRYNRTITGTLNGDVERPFFFIALSHLNGHLPFQPRSARLARNAAVPDLGSEHHP